MNRTKAMEYRITLIDTLFNRIYRVACHAHLNRIKAMCASDLNWFYTPSSSAGMAVYNSNHAHVHLSNWVSAVEARRSLLRGIYTICRKTKTTFSSKSVYDLVMQSVYGIRDIIVNLLVV